MKSEKEIQDRIIQLDNESDELVIERNKCSVRQPYYQTEITNRMYIRNALLWVIG